MKNIILAVLFLTTGLNQLCAQDSTIKIDAAKLVYYTIDPQEGNLHLYHSDDDGTHYGNFIKLKQTLNKQGEQLTFAMNGGMYQVDRSPQGLYIEKGKLVKKMNKVQEAHGNFYMQPNGIFYLTNANTGHVCTSSTFDNDDVKYATQSGPMLVIDGQLHHKFIKGSKNLNIRNGVGILPNGTILFAMSKEKINFYDFATFFKQQGCANALYLDGFVSRTYLPSKNWEQTDGNFGVIIAEINELKK